MPVLHIQHHVADYDTWKRKAFDPDPLGRSVSGVRGHRIFRDANDPNYLVIELDFATLPEAEAMHARLRSLWRKPLVQISEPTARIVETVEAMDY
jgi:hypothetical protein